MVLLHLKIAKILDDRGLLRRDLARALGISPQTATDICKGRSAVTLTHLRSLIKFFGLRADFWLDDSREDPSEIDRVAPELWTKIRLVSRTEIFLAEDPAGMFERMRMIVTAHPNEYMRRFGEPAPEERRLLQLPGGGNGSVGRIG